MKINEQIKNASFSKLSQQQIDICWHKGTEPAFSGQYLHHQQTGTYCCICCNRPLFHSNSKYDSGSGWPSFFTTCENAIVQAPEADDLHARIEICCGGCGSHLGHVFKDGPPPTGLRYCVNSASLSFIQQIED